MVHWSAGSHRGRLFLYAHTRQNEGATTMLQAQRKAGWGSPNGEGSILLTCVLPVGTGIQGMAVSTSGSNPCGVGIGVKIQVAHTCLTALRDSRRNNACAIGWYPAAA